VRPEGLGKIPMTRDIQACREVPQPSAPPRAKAPSIPSLKFPSQVLATVRLSDGHSSVVNVRHSTTKTRTPIMDFMVVKRETFF